MRIFRIYILPLLVAALVLMLVRSCLATQCAVAKDMPECGLLAGDRVLVLRTSYGLRMPLESVFGYRRYGFAAPEKGDVVAHTATDGSLMLSRIVALPGEKINGAQPIPAGHYQTTQGLVAHSALVGRVSAVSYSVNAEAPWYRSLRTDRFFKSIL